MNTHCVNHPNKVFVSFCILCDRLVCLQCLVGNDHLGHQIMSLREMLQDRQERLQTLESKEINLDSRASEEEHNISERAETLYMNIKAAKAQLSEELDQCVKEHTKHLSIMKMDFKNEINFLQKFLTASENDGPNIEEDEQDITDGPQCHLSSSPPPLNEYNIPHFSFDNDSDVSEVFGSFEKEICDSEEAVVGLEEGLDKMSTGTEPVDESGNSTLMFCLKKHTDGVVRICPSSYNNSWVTVCGSKKITLYFKDGSNIKNIPTRFRVFDIGVNQKQELFATEISGHHVWKVSSNAMLRFSWTQFASFSKNYVTNGIHVNDSNHIWVCLQNKQFDGKVVRLSQSGAVSQTIELNAEKKRLLKCPLLVHQNTCTGDVLIVDGAAILVFCKLGRPIFSISAASIQSEEQVEEAFTPLGMANDKEGNIITSDFGNKKVWMFNKAGNFMRCLNASHSGPTGIILHSENELLVALSDGKLIVLRI